MGDILVLGDRGAQLLVAPQLADFLCEALTSVRALRPGRPMAAPRDPLQCCRHRP